jgi:hypothetical protein
VIEDHALADVGPADNRDDQVSVGPELRHQFLPQQAIPFPSLEGRQTQQRNGRDELAGRRFDFANARPTLAQQLARRRFVRAAPIGRKSRG